VVLETRQQLHHHKEIMADPVFHLALGVEAVVEHHKQEILLVVGLEEMEPQIH